MISLKLYNCLKAVWHGIEQMYLKGQICSEYHLQAELFSLLKPVLSEIGISMHLTPTIELAGEISNNDIKGLKPDIVFTHEKKVIAIAEIKIQKGQYLAYGDDFLKLAKFNESKRTRIYLKAKPFEYGWETNETFEISEQLILIPVMIGLHGSDAFNLDSSFKNKNIFKTIPNYIQCDGIIYLKKNNEMVEFNVRTNVLDFIL